MSTWQVGFVKDGNARLYNVELPADAEVEAALFAGQQALVEDGEEPIEWVWEYAMNLDGPPHPGTPHA